MIRQHWCAILALTTVIGIALTTQAGPIPVLNPGGEDYAVGGNVALPLAPIPPADGTGWNATSDTVAGNRGVESIANNAHSGTRRLAFGATAASEVDPQDAILFQQTSHIVAEGDQYSLSFFGRGFFEYANNVDSQASLFGYIDGDGNLVQVHTQTHPQIATGVWTEAVHTHTVPALSPLIGEKLVIGFFTNAADGGGFSAIDDVSLTLVPEPSAWYLAAAILPLIWERRRDLRRSQVNH